MSPAAHTIKTTLALVVIGLSTVCGLHIRVNNKTVVPILSKDVQILCNEDDLDMGANLVDIVLTASRDNSSHPVRVASISTLQPSSPVAYVDDISVFGFIGQGQASFLLVVWREATFNTQGTYQCKARVSPSNVLGREIVSPKVTIKENFGKLCSKLHSPDIGLELMHPTRARNVKSLLHRLGKLVKNQTISIEATIERLFHRLDGRITELLKDKIIQRKARHVKERQRHARQWPAGRYSLLSTDKGCPESSAFNWTEGYFRHHTESSAKHRFGDAVSPKSNFAKPVMEKVGDNHYFYTHYCSKSAITSGSMWPRGHYCINRLGNRCPPKFKNGYVFIDNEDKDNNEGSFKGPDGDASRVYYCCRSDGDVNRPVSLPSTHPFYLYRFGGKCQTVKGMHVNSQWFFLDTENTNNSDRYKNDHHPDGQAKSGVKIYACHYRPHQHKMARSAKRK